MCGTWSRAWPFCEPCEADRRAHLDSFGESSHARSSRAWRWAEDFGMNPLLVLLAENMWAMEQLLIYGDPTAPEPVGVLSTHDFGGPTVCR